MEIEFKELDFRYKPKLLDESSRIEVIFTAKTAESAEFFYWFSPRSWRTLR